MSSDLVELGLGANRVLTYTGYVLLAGTLTFWVLVWPQGRSAVRLVRLTILGTVLLTIATVAGPGVQILLGGQLIGDTLTSLTGATLIIRLAALTGVAFFLPDLVRGEVVGARRVIALVLVIIIAGTLVTQSNAIGGPWEVAKIIATTGHVLATAAWLGGLVAMTTVLIPRENLEELDRLIPRFSVVATGSVTVLALTGVVHALAVAGSVQQLVTSRYGLVLLIKLLIFGGMLLLGNHGRAYAARVAFRASYAAGSPEMARSPGVHGLAVVMVAELAIAFVILGTTSVLVAFAPTV